jgi:hypothetical protein
MLNHVLLQPSIGEPIEWYEPADNAREVLDQFPDMTFSHLEWESWAWPGGYEIHYYTVDGGVLCHECANAELPRTLDPDDTQFHIVAEDVNWEDPDFYCDHCNRQIKSEYGGEE